MAVSWSLGINKLAKAVDDVCSAIFDHKGKNDGYFNQLHIM